MAWAKRIYILIIKVNKLFSFFLSRCFLKEIENMFCVSIEFYITQVILAFWLVLAYDLLEDRCTIDVIITKFFPSAVLKWRKVLRIRVTFYVTEQNIRYRNVLPKHWTGSISQETKDIAAKMCLRHYIKLIWESPTTEDKNLHRHLRSAFHSKLDSNGL